MNLNELLPGNYYKVKKTLIRSDVKNEWKDDIILYERNINLESVLFSHVLSKQGYIFRDSQNNIIVLTEDYHQDNYYISTNLGENNDYKYIFTKGEM